ncbi:hypothetical protein ECG_07579 [Echinococcus granulosus]|uniref:Expressed protein n=2 Tax=Echinococcus TaxID=6209 RepID=A0A068X2E5_ECHGR|nr:hypothetical protein ECG_07579 [Echinococcus granulosus]CDS24158.1 expressed protein [Echinococcus granulosus]CDS39314.1 expressed protein [Echinococcus multilocularis]
MRFVDLDSAYQVFSGIRRPSSPAKRSTMPRRSACCPKALTYYQYNESPATEHYEYFHVKNGSECGGCCCSCCDCNCCC